MKKKVFSLMPSSLSGAVSFSWLCCRIQAQNQRPCSYVYMHRIKRDLLYNQKRPTEETYKRDQLYKRPCSYVYMCVCMCVYMYIHLCACVCVCVYIYIYIYIYIYMYVLRRYDLVLKHCAWSQVKLVE